MSSTLLFFLTYPSVLATFSVSSPHKVYASCEGCTFCVPPLRIRCDPHFLPDSLLFLFLDYTVSASYQTLSGLASALSSPRQVVLQRSSRVVSGPSCHASPPGFSTVVCLELWSVASTASLPCPHHLPHHSLRANHHHLLLRCTCMLHRRIGPAVCFCTSCQRNNKVTLTIRRFSTTVASCAQDGTPSCGYQWPRSRGCLSALQLCFRGISLSHLVASS